MPWSMDGEWSDLHLHWASGHDRVRVFRGSPHCQRRHLSFGGRTELRARPRAHEARHEVDPGLKVLRPSQVEVEKQVHYQARLQAKNHGLANLEGAAARGNLGVHQTCDVKRDLSFAGCRHNMCDVCHTILQIALLTSPYTPAPSHDSPSCSHQRTLSKSGCDLSWTKMNLYALQRAECAEQNRPNS